MHLHQDDFKSPVWGRVAERLRARIEALRLQNDSNKLTEVETAAIRGGIAELKLLLNLAEQRPGSHTVWHER